MTQRRWQSMRETSRRRSSFTLRAQRAERDAAAPVVSTPAQNCFPQRPIDGHTSSLQPTPAELRVSNRLARF
jgi:hypothetical protein